MDSSIVQPRAAAVSPRSGLALLLFAVGAATFASPSVARAEDEPPAGDGSEEPTGAPPPDATALVVAPKSAEDVPDIEGAAAHATSGTISAGGQLATGNSRLLGLTAQGAFDMRRGYNGMGASILGNYGQGAAPGKDITATAENLQGRLRYDRYVSGRASVFLIGTGRHDRFQGLDFRLNVDPGFKLIVAKTERSAFWSEAGYDFQYDIRKDTARVPLDASGGPAVDASGAPLPLLDKTATDHSTRLFFGYRHAFNKEVTLTAGVEYLQSFVHAEHYRINGDALFAAKVGGGLALGFGFSARYDRAPLPGKEDTDTSTVVSLIYSFDDNPHTPEAIAPCATPAAPAPAAAPPPSPAPSSSPASPSVDPSPPSSPPSPGEATAPRSADAPASNGSP